MEGKSLKGKLHIITIDFTAPGIPASVASLMPTLYQERESYIAWHENNGNRYYGFGRSADAALQDFDRNYQQAQRRKQHVHETLPETKQEPVNSDLPVHLRQWFTQVGSMHLYPLRSLLKKKNGAA